MLDKLGLGTYKLIGDDCSNMVYNALRMGYRTIDSADLYNNHQEIIKGIKNSEIPRDEICLISKIKLQDIKKNNIEKSIDKILIETNSSNIDILLLHGPVNDIINETAWKTLIKLKDENIIEEIGVSNYSISNIDYLINNSSVKPFLNQIEINPFNNRFKLAHYCQKNDIIVQAYCGLTNGIKLNDALLNNISGKYGISVAQLLLLWGYNQTYYQIPKTSNINHLRENYNITYKSNIKIESCDIDSLNNLNENFCIFKKWNN